MINISEKHYDVRTVCRESKSIMSKRKNVLEDNEDSLGERRTPSHPTSTGNVSGRSGHGTAEHQTDNQNEEDDSWEFKNSEIKNKSVFQVLKKHFPKAVERSQEDDFKNMETSLQIIKQRCELFQKFAEQSTLLQNTTNQNVTTSCQQLLRSLQMYHNGSALLLKERCYFFLMYGEYLKAFIYAEQLANLAATLLDTDLQEEAKSILSKKFTEIKDKPTASLLHKKHKDAQTKSEKYLEGVRSGSQRRRNEYAIFSTLYKTHLQLFNMQEALDLNSECLKIACELNDETMLVDMIYRKALIYDLLGKRQDSYDILTDISPFQTIDNKLKCRIMVSFSVVSLLLGKKTESLQLAWKSLSLAQTVGESNYIACSYGNLGLAEESLGNFAVAIQHYEKCFHHGKKAGDDRIINNSYCNFGRVYEGLGEKDKAKEYYQKAVDTPQPPKTHWGDTEDFRFSGDFLLAKMAIDDQNWSEARGYLQQVLERCDLLRRSVQDSSLKITFNDTQRKPYQYLQYVLLQEGAKEDALLVAEKGRARDFYDKVASEEGDQSDCLNTPQALLDFVKSRKVAVLFLSILEVVDKICGWFISPDGSIKEFSTPQSQWTNILHTQLCVSLYQLQSRHKIEFRGIEDTEDDEEDATIQQVVTKATCNHDGELKDGAHVAAGSSNFQPACQPQSCSTTNQTLTIKRGAYSANGTKPNATKSLTPELLGSNKSDHGPSSESEQGTQLHKPSVAANADDTDSLSTLIHKLSELVVKPIELQLKKLIEESTDTCKPQLLIIPQGMTFNIPYAALHLNRKPLCSQITTMEAFSFHSFSHSIQQHEKSKEERDILQDALVVGNPTNDLHFAEAEAIQIAKFLGVSPLIGESATLEEVLSRLPHQRIIHFACHGQYNGSSLQMASVGKSSASSSSRKQETFLTIEDVEKLKIRADMVVLSACDTARGRISSEGVLGLSRAFLMAGAKSVVTALWAIPDDATELFMEQFYSNLSNGQPVANALRTTMCQMQDTNEFKNVVNWGSFKAFGANQRVL